MWFNLEVHFTEDDFENWKIREEKEDASIEDFIEATYYQLTVYKERIQQQSQLLMLCCQR